MAQIDVTELLLDPDFVDPVQVLRITTVVNDFGENELTEAAPIDTVASVQPASGKQIQRLPEALRIADVRAFYIMLEIIQDSTSAYPDVIVWQGQRYQVQLQNPWLNFGQGWNEVIAIREKPS